jgi:hypothetical protein
MKTKKNIVPILSMLVAGSLLSFGLSFVVHNFSMLKATYLEARENDCHISADNAGCEYNRPIEIERREEQESLAVF